MRRPTETEGEGGSNKDHEVENKKRRNEETKEESRMSSSSVCTYILMYSFICMRISVGRVFIRECIII